MLGWEEPINEKMQLGIDLEEKARSEFEIEKGNIFLPRTCECSNISYIGASFDGLSRDFREAVEIKCGKASFKMASKGIIPQYYVAQMQHLMYVAGLDCINYFCFNENNFINIILNRDNQYITNLIEKEMEFWDFIINRKPPEG
jgi:putative phage-type endonuclease